MYVVEYGQVMHVQCKCKWQEYQLPFRTSGSIHPDANVIQPVSRATFRGWRRQTTCQVFSFLYLGRRIHRVDQGVRAVLAPRRPVVVMSLVVMADPTPLTLICATPPTSLVKGWMLPKK